MRALPSALALLAAVWAGLAHSADAAQGKPPQAGGVRNAPPRSKLEAAMDPRELDARLLEEKDPRRIVEAMRAACGAPCAYVPFLKGPLDEVAWALAEPLPLRFLDGGGSTPTQRTAVRLAADDRFLHVAFRCSEDDLDGLAALVEERDGGIWSDDCVEVLLDPRGEPGGPGACGRSWRPRPVGPTSGRRPTPPAEW